MTQPTQPEHPKLPGDGPMNPGTADPQPQAPNGVPDNMDADPKGTPNADRHDTEKAPGP